MPQSADQFSGIFICYRREDSGGHAGRLCDRLIAHFGDEQIFMDLDRIEPGEDFVQVIERAVGSCEILLALVGRSWLTSRDETGRRLDNPNDFVRVEIAAAFARDVRLIPVLVQGAQMPRAQDLPEALRPLSRRHAFELSDQRWRQDVDSLVGTLERILARQREARRAAAEEEAERQRREAEAQRQAETEAEAQRQAEESERRRRAAAETERRRLETEAAERLRLEAEERDRLAAKKAAPVADENAEPAQATTAHDSSTVKILRTPIPASSLEDQDDAPPAAPQRMSKSERAALVGVIACVIAFTAVWVLTRWNADATQVNANRNPTPAETPRAGPKETPSPAAETPRPPAGMVYVPGGKFTMGRDDGDEYERPAHEVTVEPFFIDIYEVTREDYKKCVAARRCPLPQGWTDGTYPERTERLPVTGVDWYAANAYAEWRSQRDRVYYRLPREEEWEFAARGTDGRLYPWGNDWRAGLANAANPSGAIVDVDSYHESESPFGVLNTVGNVWEWTASELMAYKGGQIPVRSSLGYWRIIRGGSYQENRDSATTTYRRGYPVRGAPDYSKIGFRCVLSLTPPSPVA